MTDRTFATLILVLLFALILMGACGCTISRVYVYAPTYQIGVGHHYQRSTDITADDSDTADVSTEADADLRLPLSP